MRKMMWFTIGFASLCALGAFCLLDTWLILLLTAVLMLWAGIAWKHLRRFACVCIGGAVALCWFLCFQHYRLSPAKALDGQVIPVTFTATEYSFDTGYGIGVDGTMEIGGKEYRIRIYVNEAASIDPGDRVCGEFLMHYTPPGGLEETTHHSGKGIFLLGYQRGNLQITEGEPEGFSPAVLAHRMNHLLQRIFPEDVVPFARALLLGDSTLLDYQTETALKVSGIRHIIAVSGLHVMIIYHLISAATVRRRYLTALVGIPILAVFAAIAGFTPSVSRACIMAGLMMLSQMADKEYDSATALSFASLVLLIWNPLVIGSVSFQLSASSVVGILLFREPINKFLQEKFHVPAGKSLSARVYRWIISSASVTLSAMSLTTTLSAYYFSTVSLIGVLTNLLTLWVISGIFAGTIAACLVSFLSVSAATVLASIVAWAMRYVLAVAKFLAGFPLAAVYCRSIYITAWLVFLYVLLAAYLLLRKKNPTVLICCAVMGLCTALMASWLEPFSDDVRLTVLDVGQGQCILIQNQGRTFLIDCGGDDDEDAADLAAETLLAQGISRLDGIILTHEDRDHSGGLINLLSRVQTDLLVISDTTNIGFASMLESAAEGEVISLSGTLEISLGNEIIRVFGPSDLDKSNENSLCVLFDGENCDILITGDRGTLGEKLLLWEQEIPQLDVLIVGHHGSKYSTSEELLQSLQPDVAIISVGADNSYSHPAQEVLDRLTRYGCRIYRTDQDGTIIFRR